MEVGNLGAGGGESRHERDLALVGPISGDGLGSCDEEVTVVVRRALDDQRILGVVALQLHSSPGNGCGIEESVDAGVLTRLAKDDALNRHEATWERLLWWVGRRVNWDRRVRRWRVVGGRVSWGLNRSVGVRRVSRRVARRVSVVVVSRGVGRCMSWRVDRWVNWGGGWRVGVRVRVGFGVVVVVAVSGWVRRGGYWVCIVTVMTWRNWWQSLNVFTKNGEAAQ